MSDANESPVLLSSFFLFIFIHYFYYNKIFNKIYEYGIRLYRNTNTYYYHVPVDKKKFKEDELYLIQNNLNQI